MRACGFLVGGTAGLHQAPTPGARVVNSIRHHRRRLDDSLVDIFRRATASNNLDAAADLLTVLEKWHLRRKTKYGRERRIGDAEIKTMRTDLNRLTALRIS